MKLARWFHLALVAGSVVVVAAACNSITGLNDFEKVDCVGACGGSGGGADASSDTTSPDATTDATAADVDGGPDVEDSGSDVVKDAVDPWDGTIDAMDGGVVDPRTRWARFKMPHEVVPEGGTAPGPTPADAAAFDADFLDKVTGLKWGVTEAEGAVTYGEAVAICADQSGASTYRLPTRIELVTLLEPGRNPPYHSVFGDTIENYYWTASDVFSLDPSESKRWVVDFRDGFVTTRDETQKAHVRCIIE